MRVIYSRWEWEKWSLPCCVVSVPSGRQLDTFDADIVIDMAASQTCFQICRGEGDIVMWRLPGGDVSSDETRHNITDDPRVFNVFSDMTLELSKMNLKDAAAMGLGRRMGAAVHTHDARYRMDGPATQPIDGEFVYYDSATAKRTLIGSVNNLDCCLPPVYKITSERVLHVEWDVWYPCDDPCTSFPLLPWYFIRGVVRDCCCGLGGGNGEKSDRRQAARAADKAFDSQRNVISRCCCAWPVGRTAHFFDLDLVVDVGAHQRCGQLFLNEGDLLLHRLSGGDASDPEKSFKVTNVPEVFSTFDDLSYDMSKMDLTHFRQSAVAQRMIR